MESNLSALSTQPTTVAGGAWQLRTPSTASVDVEVPQLAEVTTDLMKKRKFELSIADESIVKVLDQINRKLAGIPREVEYSLHRADGQMVIKIVNSETKEVLKEVPPENILDMLEKFKQLNQSNGAIIDEKR